MMDIRTLIKNEIVKIIEDASYICATSWVDAKMDHTTEKLQAMTNSFDTHLTILLRNYKDETIVSVYPWPTMEGDFDNSENPGGQVTKRSIDKLPIPYTFDQRSLKFLLDEMKVYFVPADLDLIWWISNSSDRDTDFRSSSRSKVSTAFFKIRYGHGESYRNCFESIRSVIVGNCLTKRAA